MMTENTDSMDTTAYNIRLSDVADEPEEWLSPIEGYETMPLVTLNEAIISIIGIVPKIEQKVYFAKHNCALRSGALTLDQKAAIMLYTMEVFSDEQPFYSILNSILRWNKPDRREQLKPWFSYLKLFITALSHIPSYRGTVYRGVKLDLSEYYTCGKKFVWWAFSSCTKSLHVLESQYFLGQEEIGTIFVIECFSGKEIRQYSKYEKEDEILLIAARQFEVVSRLNRKPYLWIIHVREIEPPFPFLTTDSSISSTLEMSFTNDTNNSAPTNICSQCSKTITVVSTPPADTPANDLPCDAKFEQETSSDGKSMLSNLNTNQSVSLDAMNSNENVHATDIPDFVEDVLSASLPSFPMNLVVAPVATTSNAQTNEHIMHSATNLNNTQDKIMYFLHKVITEETAISIAKMIRENVALEILHFFNNGLEDRGLHYILQAIFRHSCLEVFIKNNEITDLGAIYIANILSDFPCVMLRLYLDRNRLTAQGVRSIVQAILHSSDSCLQTLSFTGNSLIDDECIDDIIELLIENQTLRTIYLQQCNLSEDGKTRLEAAVATRAAFCLYL